jgi:hypothetical protein
VEITWKGGTVELDVPVNDTLAFRATGRWQSFSDVYDECTFDFIGQQVDATGGLLWRPRSVSDWQYVHPFFAGQVGAGLERLHTTCAGAQPFNRWSWLVHGSAGIDVDSDATARFAIRIEARFSVADFVPKGGELDQVFNQEVGAAVLVIARL